MTLSRVARRASFADVIDFLARVPTPALLMYGVIPNQDNEFDKPGLAFLKHSRSVTIPAAGAFAR